MREPCMSDVAGLARAKRALEIAAAGGHNVLLVGPPGAGKTMLARRLPGILPEPSAEELVELDAIASSVRLLATRRRPFRAPHHTASVGAFVGSTKPALPGEVMLAHGGVLFLDELLDFSRPAFGAAGAAHARGESCPLIVGAVNPCPCGWTDTHRPCTCAPEQRAAWRRRILIRSALFPIVVELEPSREHLAPAGETSEAIRARVTAAREAGAADGAVVARTIALLDGSPSVLDHHVAEAESYRWRAIDERTVATR